MNNFIKICQYTFVFAPGGAFKPQINTTNNKWAGILIKLPARVY
jgi:hypothetical protein